MPTAGVIVPRVTDSFDPPLVDANDIAALCAVRSAMVVACLRRLATRSARVTECQIYLHAKVSSNTSLRTLTKISSNQPQRFAPRFGSS